MNPGSIRRSCGPWIYATVDDGQFDRIEGGCLVIGTLVSFEKLRQYFGEHMVIPVYVEDGGGTAPLPRPRPGTAAEPSPVRGDVPEISGG